MTILAFLFTLALRFTTGFPMRAAGIALAMLLSWVATERFPLMWSGYFEADGFDRMRTSVYSGWVHGAVGILMAAYFFYWDRARLSLKALRDAQLAQQRAEHGVLESRLNVLRARVDPTFLFAALDAVRRLYGQRVDAAERLLDDLINFLRATLPQSREQASSMAEEVHLCAMYLEVCGAISGRRVRLRSDLVAELAQAFFPPRVLAPLVEGTASRARADSPGITVRARLEGDRARVTLEEEGCASDDDGPVLREVAMTLRAFFGPDARVRSRAVPTGRIVTLEYLHAESPRKGAP